MDNSNSEKILATLYYGFGHEAFQREQCHQIGLDTVNIPAINSPSGEIFPAKIVKMSKILEGYREKYNKYTKRRTKTAEGTDYDLISEQLDCDRATVKYHHLKAVPLALAMMSDLAFMSLVNSKESKAELKSLSKYGASSGLNSICGFYSKFGIDFKTIFNKAVKKYFKDDKTVEPAPSSRIINLVGKDAVARYKEYVQNKNLLGYTTKGHPTFAKKIQSKFRTIGYTFTVNEAKPMLAYSKSWEIMIWIKHPLLKSTVNGNRPIYRIPANRHTTYFETHKLVDTPEKKLETLSKCYLKVYGDSTLPCLLFNKAHRNIELVRENGAQWVKYKNANSIAAVFPELEEETGEILLSIAYTPDITKQQIEYLNTTIYAHKASAIWRKLTAVKATGTKSRKAGGSAYLYTGKQYSNMRFAFQNELLHEIRNALPENVGRVLFFDVTEESFKSIKAQEKPKVLYDLGFSFNKKSNGKIFKYKSFIMIHDECIKALARTCRNRGILMSAVPISNVHRTCHVCGYTLPINGRAICSCCATAAAISAQSSQDLHDLGISDAVADEYTHGSFTATNLILSLINRDYQTIRVLGRSDRTESDLLCSLAESGMARSKFSPKSREIPDYSEQWGVKFEKFKPVEKLPTKSPGKSLSIDQIASEFIKGSHDFPVCKLLSDLMGDSKYFTETEDWLVGYEDQYFQVYKDLGITDEDVATTSYYEIAKTQYINAKKTMPSREAKAYNDFGFGLYGTHAYYLDNRQRIAQNLIRNEQQTTEYQYEQTPGKLLTFFDEKENYGTLKQHQYDWKNNSAIYDNIDKYDGIGIQNIHSLALQCSFDLKIQALKITDIDIHEFHNEIRSLASIIRGAVIAYERLCGKLKEQLEDILDREELLKLKGITDQQQELLIAHIDLAIIKLYAFNEKYRELLELSYTGMVDIDDFLDYLHNDGKILELLNAQSVESILIDETWYTYKPFYYTNLKSLAKFYQYFYGIIAQTYYAYLKSNDFEKESTYSTLHEWLKEPCSGMHENGNVQMIWFKRFFLNGSAFYIDDYIEPMKPDVVEMQTKRRKLLKHRPSYFMSSGSDIICAGKTKQFAPATTQYTTVKWALEKDQDKRDSIVHAYEYDVHYPKAISAFYVKTHCHPLNSLEDATYYNVIRSIIDPEYRKAMNELPIVNKILNSFDYNRMDIFSKEYLEFKIRSSKELKNCIDKLATRDGYTAIGKFCIDSELLKTILKTGRPIRKSEIEKIENKDQDKVEVVHNASKPQYSLYKNKIEYTMLKYCNDFENLDLAIPEIRGTEHVKRSSLWNVNTSSTQKYDHRGQFTVEASKTNKKCAALSSWLRSPFNANKLLNYQLSFRDSIVKYYKPQSEACPTLKDNASPLRTLYKLGLIQLLNPAMNNNHVADYLMNLANVPMRFFSENARYPMCRFPKPNDLSQATPKPEKLQMDPIQYWVSAVLPKRFQSPSTTFKPKYSKTFKRKARSDWRICLFWHDIRNKLIRNLLKHKNSEFSKMLDVKFAYMEACQRFERCNRFKVFSQKWHMENRENEMYSWESYRTSFIQGYNGKSRFAKGKLAAKGVWQ